MTGKTEVVEDIHAPRQEAVVATGIGGQIVGLETAGAAADVQVRG